jgi:diguanylate cyclase (GGDEF)-like protein/PAS domain S-box-containing protein
MTPYKKYLRFLLPALPIILGALALVGWILNVAFLKQGIASGVAMNPATALGFILLGLEALRLHARIKNPLVGRIGQLAIWVVIIASAMKLGDLVLGTSFGIDQLLFAAQLDKYLAHPNRMAPNTALCFFLLGWATLFLRSRSKEAISTAQALAMIPALFIPLAIVGYIYGTESFYGLGSYIPMAFNTAIAFLFLIAAILFTYPHEGYMRVFNSGGAAAKIAPVLLPATLIVPFLVGWITLAALNAKLIDPALDHALSVVVNIAIFFALSYFSIRTLYFSDHQRQKAEAEQKLAELKAEELKIAKIKEALLRRNQTLMQNAMDGIHIMDMQGNVVEANDSFCQMLGYTKEEMASLNVADWDAQWSAEELRENFKLLIGKNARFETVHRSKDGALMDVEITTSGMEIAGQNLLFAASRDITERKRAEQGIQDQQARINGLVDAAMDAIVSTDENQNIIIFNHGAERMFGYRAADIVGQNLDLLIPIRYRETHSKHVDEYGKTGITTRTMNQPGQSYGLRANGDEFPFEATISRVNVAGKTVFTAILRDTTQRKLTEDELRIAAVAFESKEGMLVTDAHGTILRVNQAFTETTGYTAEEAVGKTPSLLKSGRHNADFYRAMWESINRTGTWQGEIWDRRKNGEVYPKWLTITAVKGSDGIVTHYVGSHVDITERKAAEDEVKNLAFFDPLTHLPNRRLLLDRLDHALASSMRSGREGALMFIDLDNFKTLNDTLGHNIGDLLLQHVAQRLESCVREGDTVARLGGDEFVVMLEDLSKDPQEAAAQTEAIGEKILTTLNQTYQLATHEYHSTPSIGATLFTDHQFGVDVLFKQADIAMYQSKKAGRNTLRFFDPQMQDTINVRAALESELRTALENQQFHLYYQIQVDDTYRPLGAEALIRWNHPDRGLVSPFYFIPLAEETGLILPIGQWVLKTACAQLKVWQQDELTRDLTLSVNVSARQFRQPDFVAQVQAAVLHHAINPLRLKLELTESLLLENIEDTIATMSALKEMGIRFSLDDFGTGYSSLQYLKRLPLEQLKIDQSFVRDLALDSSDQAIVLTIIAMAHSLKLGVIAEGVETEEQRQRLLNKGCTHFQGYLFGRPLPIEQFDELLKHG